MPSEQQLRDALQLIAAGSPAADDVLTRLTLLSARELDPGTRHPQTMRLRSGLTLGLAVAVVVAAVVVAQLVRRPTPDPADRRVPGYFAMVSHLAPPPGWTVDSREVWGNYETTAVVDASGKGVCWVEIDGRGAAPQHPVPADAEPVTVAGRPGRYRTRPHAQVELYWQHSSDAWASVSCDHGPAGLGGARSPGAIRDLVVGLAQSVTFGEYPLLVPIRIGGLPEGFHVTGVQEAGAGWPTDWAITISPGHVAPTGADITLGASVGDHDRANSHVHQYPATLATRPLPRAMTTASSAAVSITSLCVPTAPIGICVSTRHTLTDDPQSRSALLQEVAAQISYAASPTDSTTWFDAANALPS